MIRRTLPIRRTRLKVWRRPKSDKVTPELAADVFERDGECVVWKLWLQRRIEYPGTCRSRFGDPLAADLTLHHLWRSLAEQAKGQRPPSDRQHVVVACGWHHLEGREATRHDVLEAIRDYLGVVAPQAAEMDATS